jgi:hypothetical protein
MYTCHCWVIVSFHCYSATHISGRHLVYACLLTLSLNPPPPPAKVNPPHPSLPPPPPPGWGVNSVNKHSSLRPLQSEPSLYFSISGGLLACFYQNWFEVSGLLLRSHSYRVYTYIARLLAHWAALRQARSRISPGNWPFREKKLSTEAVPVRHEREIPNAGR